MTTDNTKPGRRGFLGLLAAAGPAVKVVFEEKAAATEIAKMVAEDIAPVAQAPEAFTRLASSYSMAGSGSPFRVMVSGSWATGRESLAWGSPWTSDASDDGDEEKE